MAACTYRHLNAQRAQEHVRLHRKHACLCIFILVETQAHVHVHTHACAPEHMYVRKHVFGPHTCLYLPVCTSSHPHSFTTGAHLPCATGYMSLCLRTRTCVPENIHMCPYANIFASTISVTEATELNAVARVSHAHALAATEISCFPDSVPESTKLRLTRKTQATLLCLPARAAKYKTASVETVVQRNYSNPVGKHIP